MYTSPSFEEYIQGKTELHVYLPATYELKLTTYPAEFWVAVTIRFSKLFDIALICLSVPLPVNSVATEQLFSFYSDILCDDCRSIKAENLLMYTCTVYSARTYARYRPSLWLQLSLEQ